MTTAAETVGWMLALASGAAAATMTAGAEPSRPNIVLMLADDQGWNGLSVAMHPDRPGARSDLVQTPHLEQLAAAGMRFSAAYAPAPVCSPTRIAIQTGKSPARLHWTKAAPPERGHRLVEPDLVKRIAADETTVAELLGAAGYATAHYGKWHIAGGGPGPHGYDEHDGDTGNESATRFTDPNPVDIFGMAERAEAFMKKQAAAGRPFFVQLSWNALHAPGNARRATLEKYARLTGGTADDRRTAVAAIADDLDAGVGAVLDAIGRLGLAGTTYVIYTSDNGAGGAGRRGGLGGGKGSVFEGGIRVPFIVRGPGVAAGSWCHAPIVGYDLLPTFAAWAGIPDRDLPAGIEGGSIAGLVAAGGAGKVVRPREELVFHFPHYQSGHAPHSAIRLGDLKLLRFYEDDTVRLFDLSRDAGEEDDLAAARPGEAARLRTLLDAHLAAVGAQLPTVNPEFDPAGPPPERRKGAGRKRGGDAGRKKSKARPEPEEEP